MAEIAGRLQELDWGGNAVNGIVDGTLNTETEELDTTTHDDGGDRTYIAGRSSHTLDLTLKYDEADTAQAAMLTAANARTTAAIAFRMQASGGLIEYTGTGLITSSSLVGSNDDVAEFNMTIRVTGALIKGTQ